MLFVSLAKWLRAVSDLFDEYETIHCSRALVCIASRETTIGASSSCAVASPSLYYELGDNQKDRNQDDETAIILNWGER